MKLRPYQEKAIQKIKNVFREKKNTVILCAPTGAGKTVIFCQIAQLTTEKSNKILIVTDRKELLSQTGNSLSRFNVDFGVVNAGVKTIPNNQAVICMIETLNIRLKRNDYKEFVNNFDVIIIDEAHKSTFNKLFKSLNDNQKVIGATATPYRTGKMVELKEHYKSIIEVVKVSELINSGYLAKPISYGVAQDLQDVKMSKGDYDVTDLTKHYDNRKIYSGVVENLKKYGNNQKTIIFCASIKNSVNLITELQNNNFNAKHIDSNASDTERNNILEWFYNSNDAILSNVGILTTGFDCPDIVNVVLYRATKSLPLFLQMCGRGSRKTEDKDFFRIFDFGNNIAEHGFWEQERLWTLENAKKSKSKKVGASPVKNCPECDALIPVSSKKCVWCGYEYELSKKEQLKAILEELKPSEVNRYASDSTIEEMEHIREIKGYKIGWLLYKLKNINEFREYAKLKKYKQGWAEYQYNRIKRG